MNNTKYEYRFESERIHPHELAALGNGAMDGFFPASFIFDSGGVTAIFDCEGYAPLSMFRIEQTSDVMYILEKILLILQRCPEYLLLPERVLILPETVFYCQDSGGIRITYIPVPVKTDIHGSITQFLIRVGVDLCDPFHYYLDRFTRRASEENLDIGSMLTLAGVLRRELDERLAQI